MINQVTLVGRLTKSPELNYTMEGKSVLNITLALNRNYRNTKGETDTDFVLCTLWGKIAENTSKYCQKGAMIGLTGRIQTRYYEEGEKRKYITEVIADSVRFINSRGKERQTAEMSRGG